MLVCLLVSAHTVNKCYFHNVSSAMFLFFFTFLCFLLVGSWLKMSLKHSAEMPSHVPKCKEAMICLMGKLHK